MARISERFRQWLPRWKQRYDKLPSTKYDVTTTSNNSRLGNGYHKEAPETGDQAAQPNNYSVGMFVFFYISISSAYINVRYALPYQYRDDSDSWLLFHQLLTVYCLCMCISHWCLTHFNTSSFTDRTGLQDYIPLRQHRREPSDLVDDTKPRNHLCWTYCNRCQRWCPPRCHHCPLCNHCILKRDHHCYFTGVCIGHTNQRFFVILVFYTGTSLLWAPGIYRYLHSASHGYQLNWSDYFFPIAWWRTLIGTMPIQVFHIINFLSFCIFLIGLGPAMFSNQIIHIFWGITIYEGKKSKPIKCTLSYNRRFREVFGRYWALNFLFPMHLWFPAESDGINWPYHYDYKYSSQLKYV